jgi:hypothetical protein
MMPLLWMLTEHVEAIHLLRKFFRSTLRRVLVAQQGASVNTTGLTSATAKLLTELEKSLVCLCTANSGMGGAEHDGGQSGSIAECGRLLP